MDANEDILFVYLKGKGELKKWPPHTLHLDAVLLHQQGVLTVEWLLGGGHVSWDSLLSHQLPRNMSAGLSTSI